MVAHRFLRLCAAPLLALLMCAVPGQASAADNDHDHPSPQPYSAATACQTAQKLMSDGNLDQAKAILTALPRPGEDPCVVSTLTELDGKREAAAQQVIEGQKHLRDGDLDKAKVSFDAAQKMDRTNPDAAAGLARVATLTNDPLRSGASNWQGFYDDWVSPIGRLLLPIVLGVFVLGLASSLTSRFLVRPASDAWHVVPRRALSTVGAVLILGTSALLPINAMFKPFTPGPPLSEAGCWLVCFLFVLVLGLMALAAYLLKRENRKLNRPGPKPTGPKPRSVFRDWKWLEASLASLLVVGLVLWRGWLSDKQHVHGQLLLIYTILVLMGVLITSAGLGQNLRLQIEAQDPQGNASAASTDYLLARLLTLGDDQPQHLRVMLTQTPLSSLQSVNISALPAGNIVSTLLRIFYTLRPDLTWRARVTEVDCNRVSITLIRNGRHADSVIFSRLDLGLPPLNDNVSPAGVDTAKARAHAQLLTGAAAFILVTLSQVHHELRDLLSGARNWKAVTLQVIASSRALIDDEGKGAELLAKAVNEDPGHLTARFDYLLSAFLRKPIEARDYIDFARTVEHSMIKPPHDQVPLAAAAQLDIRVRYTCAIVWLTGYLQSDRTDADALEHAQNRTNELVDLCQTHRRHAHQQVSWFAQQMLPFALNLQQAVQLLRGESRTSHHPHDAAQYSPHLSGDHAAQESCLKLMTNDPNAITNVLEDLRYAVLNDDDRTQAQQDPRLRPFRQEPGFRRLVGQPGEWLDLEPSAARRKYLQKHELDTPERLARFDSMYRHALARVRGINVRKWQDRAKLAQLHPSLEDPEMLKLLEDLGLDSLNALKSRLHQGRPGLIVDLRHAAEQTRRTWLPGIINPIPWLDAIEKA